MILILKKYYWKKLWNRQNKIHEKEINKSPKLSMMGDKIMREKCCNQKLL